MKELNELKSFCKELSIASGNVIRNYWRKEIAIENKIDESRYESYLRIRESVVMLDDSKIT